MPDCTTAPTFRPYAAESNAAFYTSNTQNSIKAESHPAEERILTPAEKMLEARNGGSALIVEDSPENRFSMVPNEICDARSPYRVGAAALGYWVAIKAKPPTWRFSFKGFVSTCAEGKAAVRRGLDELESKGWLLRLQPKSVGGKFSSGALWVLLNDPRNYGAVVAKYEALGFMRSGKSAPGPAGPIAAVENASDPIVENSAGEPREEFETGNDPQQNPWSEPMYRKSDIGSDQAIVENPTAQVGQKSRDAQDNAQNARSKPMYHFSDIGKSDPIKEFNKLNKLKNLNSEATQRSDGGAGTPDGSRSPEGSLGREAAASLKSKSQVEKPEKAKQESLPWDRPSAQAEECYARLESFYPRPAEGGARDRALRALDGLLRRGVDAGEVEDAARRYAADCAAKSRPKRYVLSLLTFLADARGFDSWRRASEPGEPAPEPPECAAVRKAYRRGEASDSELVPAWASQSGDARVSRLWAALASKLGADARLDSHEEYDALRRMAHSRELFPDFAAFAAPRLSSG